MPVPKITFSNIKDVVYICTIIAGIFFFFKDKAVNKALLDAQIKTVIENQGNILNKMQELDVKFEKQSEINGKVLMYIELDAH